MSDMDNMRVFADQLWKYMVPKLNAMFSSNVSYFRAVVVSNPGNNMLEVQRPVETGTLTLPCTTAMSGAQTGQQVVALVMGSLSNAVVVGDGKMDTRPMLDGQMVMTGGEDLNVVTELGWYTCKSNQLARAIKHTPGFDPTTLVNTSMVAFNMAIGTCGPGYRYQEIQLFNTGKRWYRYTPSPTAAQPNWGAWTEH